MMRIVSDGGTMTGSKLEAIPLSFHPFAGFVNASSSKTANEKTDPITALIFRTVAPFRSSD